MLTVGLFYNLRQDFHVSDIVTTDANADWDIPETIKFLQQGLKDIGVNVKDFGDPKLLASHSVRKEIDIVFSICEMQGYRFREAIVPCLCEMYGLPYVFSSPDSMMISLDKNLSNFVVEQYGCRVPAWQISYNWRLLDTKQFLNYPYFIKPTAEGSGMGLNELSIVYDFEHLQERVNFVQNSYKQPAIIQEFIAGKEYTVAVIEENNSVVALSPIEVRAKDNTKDFVYSYTIKENADNKVDFVKVNNSTLESHLKTLAENAYLAVGCRDAARVDMRVSKDGIAYFLEINPLPHLHPDLGDFCRSAKVSNVTYTELLQYILRSAVRRYNIPKND